MTRLNKNQFDKAASFIKANGRKLDSALFEYEFENGSQEKVLTELKKFQNADGGFGNGLEPDFRCKESSTLATAIGLDILAKIGVDETNDLVKNAIAYLLETFIEDRMGWQIVPKEVESAPRAIWWNYSESWEWGNPSAEIIGLLHHYKKFVPEDFLDKVTSYAIRYINNLDKYENHELLSIIKLSEKLPYKDKDLISIKLEEMMKQCVTTDLSQWNTYCLQPIQVVNSKQSEYIHLFSGCIPKNLDYLIANQNFDGYWEPTWSWGQFEDEWVKAKQEWRGWLTLENLRVLSSLGYIELTYVNN
ncbi:hypothetical protein [Bacillus sp. P14.5]|uniref:hypothetical protein n=1 Tax=Bacillus sp. P14.5 TaxID=1983400 RepID=UPI000DE96F83|nr:hypothetical protein [Bacillus sp. P14.5]